MKQRYIARAAVMLALSAGGAWIALATPETFAFSPVDSSVEKPFGEISRGAGINVVGRGRGSAWGDVDGDGFMDLGLCVQEDRFYLFKNLGGLKYADVTAESGIQSCDTPFGATFVDVDNDRDLDLFMCCGGYQNTDRFPQANRLFLNDGTGFFTEVPEAGGLAWPGYSFSSAWSDVNNDGLLDVFIVRVEPDEITGGNRLMLNEGGARFRDNTAGAGLATNVFSQQAVFFDADKDGDPDLFLTNRNVSLQAATLADLGHESHDVGLSNVADPMCRCGGQEVEGCRCGLSAGENTRPGCFCSSSHPAAAGDQPYTVGTRLYLNSGAGYFSDYSDLSGLSFAEGTFPADVADYDRDGDMDLFVGTFNFGPRGAYFPGLPDRLFRNEGRAAFTEVGAAAGIASIGGPMGTTWVDFDNDGWPDLYVARGGPEPGRYEYDRFYRNNRNGTFTEVGRSVGIINSGAGHGATAGDADFDGDLDLFVPSGAMVPERLAPSLLFENRGPVGSWICIEPEGEHNNHDAVNARVEVQAGGETHYGEIVAGSGFGSMRPANVWFGLGSAEKVDVLKVTWRSGQTREGRDIPARRRVPVLLSRRPDFSLLDPEIGPTHSASGGAVVRLAWQDPRPPQGGAFIVTVRRVDTPQLILSERQDLSQATLILPTGRYEWSVELVDGLGSISTAIPRPAAFEIAGDPAPPIPERWNAYPNPFSDRLKLEGPGPAQAPVEVSILDVRGRQVHHARLEASLGAVEYGWDGRDSDGGLVPAGLYFIRVRSAGSEETLRVVKTQGEN
jgi:hypothetical protein